MQIVASYKGNGNVTRYLKSECQGIYIDNYGAADMTFTIEGMTVTVPTGEKFQDVFGNYSSIVFTAVDNYLAHFIKGDRYGKEVVFSYQGASNETVKLPTVCNGIAVINNGGSDMTIEINGVVIVIPDGTKLNENFGDFNKIIVLAAGSYYLVGRHGEQKREWLRTTNIGWNVIQGTIAGASVLNFQDEGVGIGTGTILNAQGAGISAINEGAGKITFQVPPYTYAPFYNAGAGAVSDTTTSARNVSAPSVEGTPFKLGGWAAGSSQACTRTSPLIYNTPTEISFIDLTTTIEVNVLDADDASPIASHTYGGIGISGNGTATVNNIQITISNWAADDTRYKADVDVSIGLAAILPAGGRFSVEIVHHNSGTDYDKTQGPMFYDIDDTAAVLTGVTIAENVASLMWLSGIPFYDTGSTFTGAIADIDNINSDSYPTNFVTYDGTEYGFGTTSINGAALAGWTNAHDNTNSSYSNAALTINAVNYRFSGTLGNARARVEDWASGGWVNSANASINVDTYNQASTNLAEYFTDEAYRRTNAGAVWDSTQSLTAYDGGTGAQVIGGVLKVGDTDFSGFSPAGGQNYSAHAAPKDYYRRIIDASSLVRNSATLNISGFTVADLIASDVELWIDIPTRFTSPCFAHTAAEYNFGTFTGNNDPIRLAASAGGNLLVSFGALGLTAGQNWFELRIVINDAAIEPDSIVVSW